MNFDHCYPQHIEVSLPAARTLLLHAQGMLAPPKRPARKADALATIRRMGVLQIDTIHIVARSPYLVLFSRLGPYEPRWLDELHAEGKLFEYWSHAMCWLPIEDFRLWRHRALHGLRSGTSGDWQRAHAWIQKHRALCNHVLARIRAEGPLRSADFEPGASTGTGSVEITRRKEESKGWWNWKDEKLALELLFYTGELMVARREKFQRRYDLTERVLPGWDDANALSADEAALELTRRAALALGVATEPWLRDYYRLPHARSRAAAAKLHEIGDLLPARIEGVKAQAYIPRELLPLLRKAERGKLAAERTALLSPFDPLVWDRARNRELFGFDYTIEVYTPEHKRRYGYFVLPILHRGRLVGRLDPKAHRKDGVFEVRALHMEPGIKLDVASWAELATAVQGCADWHGTPKVVVGTSDPPMAGKQLRRALERK